MASEQGYSNQKKKGKAQFKTIHSSGSDSYAEQVIPKYLSDLVVPPVSSFISTITDIFGSNGQVEFWEIAFLDPHYAVKGDVYRIKGSADDLFNFEFEIVSVVDANTIRVLPISDVKPTSLEYGTIKRWVTANSDDDGNPKVSLVPAPTKFLLDGILTDVQEDTANAVNNRPLPVKLTGFTGDITVTANQLDVSLNNTDDSVALGDGAGNLISTFTTSSTSLALETYDLEAISTLGTISSQLEGLSFVDSDNTTQTPLGANGVYTGTANNITKFAAINVNVVSDVASATNGVTVQFSADGTNWVHSHSTTYSGGSGVGYIFNAEWQFYRVVYTNGPVAQGTFTLQTILKEYPVKQSLYTISQSVTGNMFAELGKNVIIGETTGGGGGYVPVKVTPSGALTVEASVTGSVSVSNFPATQPVSGSVSVSNFPATQPVTGSVSVSNFPATQPVSGSVSVSNFPATQAVTGTFWQAIQPVSGSVSVSNFPTTQNTAEQTQSGTITHTQKSVGSTAVRATVSGLAPSATRKKLMIKPSKNNSGAIYLGSSSVTIGDGLEIIGPDRLEFLLDSSDYYLISDTAGQIVEIIEVA